MPNAEIVADRFHVMKQINEELDKQRKVAKRSEIFLRRCWISNGKFGRIKKWALLDRGMIV